MSIYSSIDLETFKWVRAEVEVTLESANQKLRKLLISNDKELSFGLINNLHQVVGSLQMLELKSLSALILEGELLIEDFSDSNSKISKSSLVQLIDDAFSALRATFERIEKGLPENPIDVVELINQIRSARGLEKIEISSLFSPMIEVFPEVNAQPALDDALYTKRFKVLRVYYQTFMLQWLRDGDELAIDKIHLVFDKLLRMSAFGSVARLWWVASAYMDYIKHNDISNKQVHSRILRQLDDRFREIEQQGESALVRDPGEELIKIMLFYIGVGDKRTEAMDEIVSTFGLQEYFPALRQSTVLFDEEQLQNRIRTIEEDKKLLMPELRKLVTDYFEVEQTDTRQLGSIIDQLAIVNEAVQEQELGVLAEVTEEALNLVRSIRKGLVDRDDDSGFHLASALIFIENSFNDPDQVDQNWLNNGQLKLRALTALNNLEEITPEMDGTSLTGSERKALLAVVSSEVEENLKSIEKNLEAFSNDPNERAILQGIDGQIRQVRGALQVLGEQKIGLLLKMTEEQFIALENTDAQASPQLIDALATAVGTMEEYVKGLQNNRLGMDSLLDRSITDLEVAIGKKVSRDDVEELIGSASDSLFSWLENQTNFDLFTHLKSNLRDLNILARKTLLTDVEHLVAEQDRLVDIISQEPAFLTDNIVSNLQNNMASIAERIIQLYGTEETLEDREFDANIGYKETTTEVVESDEHVARFHDDMDITLLDENIVSEETDLLTPTEIGKQNAAESYVDDAIFDAFIEESAQVLHDANIQYDSCKRNKEDRLAVRELRRAFHTLKGSARMVGQKSVGEIAWYSESLFNYVLDTGKPLTDSILHFARETLDEYAIQIEQRYQNQHEIDLVSWGFRVDNVLLDTKQGEPLTDEADLSADTEVTSSTSSNVLELSPISLLSDELPVDSASEVSGSALDDLGENDFDIPSFKAIDDPEMRRVFVQEAQANLEKVSTQLVTEEPLILTGDDVVSIGIHTLLGNVRTMGLNDMAGVYDKAENLCQLKQSSGTEVTDDERQSFNVLIQETRKCLINMRDTEPYFERDPTVWAGISSNIQTVYEAAHNVVTKASTDDEPNLTLADDDIGLELDSGATDSVLIEEDIDLSYEGVEIIELSAEGESEVGAELNDNLDSDSDDRDQAQRVAAAFDDLELEGLFESESVDPEAASSTNDDELEEMQQSLNSFKGNLSSESTTARQEPSEEQRPSIVQESSTAEEPLAEQESSSKQHTSVKEAPADDHISIATNPVLEDAIKTEDQKNVAESLIPDDLTDLIQNDILEVTPEVLSPETGLLKTEELNVFDDQSEENLNEAIQSVEHQTSVNPQAPVEKEETLSQELRGVYLEEMAGLYTDLDNDVAKLSVLSEAPLVMADIMRHLHTIKGSSLMAEANAIAELTHQTETYLESNFIRNTDDLREVRQTLEHYVDTLDVSTKAYNEQQDFIVPTVLLERLGIDGSELLTNKSTEQVGAAGQPIGANTFTEPSLDVSQQFDEATSRLHDVYKNWKSARGWKKIQPQIKDALSEMEKLFIQNDQFKQMVPLAGGIQTYISNLSLDNVADFKTGKRFLGEVFENVSEDIKKLSNGEQVGDHRELISELASRLNTSGQAIDSVSVKQKARSPSGQNKQKQNLRDPSAALRIRTETLDSLTNFVGDASMNRSQMREDVHSIKSVVDELYNNVQRFGIQLRELEIEADSKITARSNESVSLERSDEFDPLELDRYSKLQQLSRGLAENLDELDNIQNSLSNYVYKAETSLQKQERLNRELQDEIMQVRLVSFGGIASQLRQVVRRTARDLNKEVELDIAGTDVRLDKAILDDVVPALEHMLRNAVDHGIESASERRKAGKPKTGNIRVECRQVAREILISIRDDGAGLEVEKIRAAAIKSKRLTPEQALDPNDMLMTISQTGFSTAAELSQISGRGVGMDVVQSTLRRMSGTLSYNHNNKQPGAMFTIRLPISLAVSSAVFVESGGIQFAIPVRVVERIVNVDSAVLIERLATDKPVIEESGQTYTLIDLAEYLGNDSKLTALNDKYSVILVDSGIENIAVIVDELLDTQEIVVKSLGGHLGRIPIYAGATIRADGQVVLLLDLVGISYYESFTLTSDLDSTRSQTVPTVMVVDDSLTVRKSAERDITGLGINALLAKNGLDAQTQLRDNAPDMILLDIEMPQMDGFELLEWIKSKDTLNHIPVVMISSRATDKYVDKANRLGCAAFLGKPYLLADLVSLFNEQLALTAPIILD